MLYLEDTYEEESVVMKVQHLETSLEQAVQNITELQRNLTYMLAFNQELKEEQRVADKRSALIISELKQELEKNRMEMARLQQDHDDYGELLADTKQALENSGMLGLQKEDQIRKLERIINEQKNTIYSLEEELLAVKYTADVSMQNLTQNSQGIEKIEQENQELKYEKAKLSTNLERQIAKNRKMEREIISFKNWLGSMTGVNKVVQGCEKILMDQVSTRLNAGKY